VSRFAADVLLHDDWMDVFIVIQEACAPRERTHDESQDRHAERDEAAH